MSEKTFVSDDGHTCPASAARCRGVLRGQPVSITDLLAAFRAKFEKEAGAPLEALDLNAALLLSDLCRHLGLSAENHDRALGEQAAAFVRRVQEERPHLRLPAEMLVPPDGGERVWLN